MRFIILVAVVALVPAAGRGQSSVIGRQCPRHTSTANNRPAGWGTTVLRAIPHGCRTPPLAIA
jgi:hypothetical protein